MKKIISIVALCLICILQSNASSIKGVISNKKGEKIPFAVVQLKQNSQLIKSAFSDINGLYELSNILNGTYDIVSSVVGYTPFISKGISVNGQAVITMNITLQEQARTLEEVVVQNKPTVNKIAEKKTEDIVVMESNESLGKKGYTTTNVVTGSAYNANAIPGVSLGTTYSWDMASDQMYIPQDKQPDLNREDQSNSESYAEIKENEFVSANTNAVSTFSIDVDNASYSNVRRMLSYKQKPPANAVRIEEMVNYFKYSYAKPLGTDPFSVNTDMMDCPWNASHKLILIGLQGKDLDYNQINPSNLVFLVDVSGSMSSSNKLPLVKQSLKILVNNLRETDRIALVAYAGNAGLVLPSTPIREKEKILEAIDKLESGGSTAGGQGIQLAYKIANENSIQGGNNRVVMCTDGDFNVGISSDNAMKELIEKEREKKIYITMVGFGMGNYKDSKMETIADNGNGNYYYIDNVNEATKVFQTDMRATLFTIAKDVKLQLYFNPSLIESYRLVGYENRMLKKEDFDNDKKDAGELGAGHTVTALYEVILKPASTPLNRNDIDVSKQLAEDNITFNADDYFVLKMRYKKPEETTSNLLIHHVGSTQLSQINPPGDNIRFASSVAMFGLLLRGSKYANQATYNDVLKLAESSKGSDVEGYRKEFIEMVRSTLSLSWK